MWAGLLVGFLPSPVFLFCISGFYQGPLKRSVYLPAFAFAFVCCLVSAFILFGKKKSVAVIVGVVLLLLNLCISFMLGCGAVLADR